MNKKNATFKTSVFGIDIIFIPDFNILVDSLI